MDKNEQQEVLKNITDATLETLGKVGYDQVILIATRSKTKDPDEDIVLRGSSGGLAYMTIRLFERLHKGIVDNKNGQQKVLKNITDATLETLGKVGYDQVILIAIRSKTKDPDEDVIVLKGSSDGLTYMAMRLFYQLPQGVIDTIHEIISHYLK